MGHHHFHGILCAQSRWQHRTRESNGQLCAQLDPPSAVTRAGCCGSHVPGTGPLELDALLCGNALYGCRAAVGAHGHLHAACAARNECQRRSCGKAGTEHRVQSGARLDPRRLPGDTAVAEVSPTPGGHSPAGWGRLPHSGGCQSLAQLWPCCPALAPRVGWEPELLVQNTA